MSVLNLSNKIIFKYYIIGTIINNYFILFYFIIICDKHLNIAYLFGTSSLLTKKCCFFSACLPYFKVFLIDTGK